MNGEFKMDRARNGLLCVANFPANTGYAWNFIEGLYARLADSPRGVKGPVYVAYPSIASDPIPLAGSKAKPVCLDLSFQSLKNCWHAMRWVRAHRVGTVYFSDRLPWSLGFLWLRLGGVRRIVVHDHTSDERRTATGVRRLLKKALGVLPWINADQLIAVSDFVARRYVGTFPPHKLRRLWNYVDDQGESPAPDAPRPANEPRLFCACRAELYKGVHVLFQAFDRAAARLEVKNVKPELLYLGNGSCFAELQRLRETLKHRDQIKMLGYREDVKQQLASADICVVPSIWQEAFALSVSEPMMCAKPVIASRVGGIPELIEDGESGMLVPAEDIEALARAIEALAVDPAKRNHHGQRARQRALSLFDRQRYFAKLEELVFGPDDR